MADMKGQFPDFSLTDKDVSPTDAIDRAAAVDQVGGRSNSRKLLFIIYCFRAL